MSKGKLILKRFNGVEEFEISEAQIFAWEDEGKVALNLEIETSKALSTLPDTRELMVLPTAEVTVYLDTLDSNKLVGSTYTVKHGMNEETDEWDGRIYYCEHEDLDENKINFLSGSNGLFNVKWSGVTQDVNYYDGSKPKTDVYIEAEFSFKKSAEWQG